MESASGDGPSFVDLCRRTGATKETLEEWRSLGLIVGNAGSLDEDFHRILLVQFLLRRGIPLPVIERANEQKRFLARYVSRMFPAGVTQTCSLEEGAAKLGVDEARLRSLREASGLVEQGTWLDEHDLGALRLMKDALDDGFPEDALLQLVRVYSDGLTRVADAELRLFHYYVYAPLKAQGIFPDDDLDRRMADRFIPLAEPNVAYFHRKGWQRACREDALLHLEEEIGLETPGDVPGQLRVAIAFVDLSDFTPLADAMGDHAAARVLERFSAVVREAAARWEGRVVKQIGDAFMLVFHDAQRAVECLLEVERRSGAEPQFPAVRSGIHVGTALYREGDYFGGCVNIAARLAAAAERHQVLVTAAVRESVGGLQIEFVPLGNTRLKGLSEEIELFAAKPTTDVAIAKLIDPVCGMELAPQEIAARLTLEGKEQVFCSERCLQRFVARPEGALPRREH